MRALWLLTLVLPSLAFAGAGGGGPSATAVPAVSPLLAFTVQGLIALWVLWRRRS
jgi:hypothetical protein